MVNSLESLVLHTVPLTVLFNLLQAVWHFPLWKPCVSALFRRSTTEELTSLAKQLPWDHPIARTLDHEVHRRKMAGKSYCFFGGSFLPSYPFFLVCRPVSRSLLSLNGPLAHPPLPLPSTMSIELGSTFLGPQLFVSIFS